VFYNLHMYLDMHDLIFEMTTSIRQDQSDICKKAKYLLRWKSL
jgi:hypothetical protein